MKQMKRRDVIGAVCAVSSAGLMPFARGAPRLERF